MIYSYKLHTMVLMIDNKSYRTKVKQNFSSQEELIQGISQGPSMTNFLKMFVQRIHSILLSLLMCLTSQMILIFFLRQKSKPLIFKDLKNSF